MNMLKKFMRNIVYYLSGFVKKNDKIIIFGSWFGNKVGDNPKYMLDYLSEKETGKIYYWIGTEETFDDFKKEYNDKNVLFLRRNTIKSFFICLRAKYIFVAQSYLDVCVFNTFRKATMVQLWHGFPIKKLGDDISDSNKYKGKTNYYCERYDYFISMSHEMSERVESAFSNWGISKENIIKSGQPRNDILVKERENIVLKNSIKKMLGIPEGAYVISYLPTFRDNSKKINSISNFSDSFYREMKKRNVYFIEKQHYVRAEEGILNKSSKENVVNPEQSIDTQKILLVTDLLISDYSSVYIDFLLLDRPLIHYLYDKSDYEKTDRGLYRPFAEEVCGPVVYESSELEKLLLNYEHNDYLDSLRSKQTKRFTQYDNGEASKMVWETINK